MDRTKQDIQGTQIRAGRRFAVVTRLALVTLLGAGALTCPVAAQLPCGYVISDIIQAPPGPLGLTSPTQATAISPNGRYVVGFFNPGGIGFDRAFAYDTQTHQFQVIPLPTGGYQSYANDVNDSGIAVGSYWKSGGVAPQRGYLYSLVGNQYLAELMPYPGASWCVASGINASNQVCGFRSIGSKGDPVNPRTAFIWTIPGGFVDLGVLVDGGTAAFDVDVAGSAVVGDAWAAGQLAMIWDGVNTTPIGPLPNGSTPFVRHVSVNGVVAGTAVTSAMSSQPFIWQSGVATLLGTLPGFNQGGTGGLNSSNTVVGSNAITPGQIQRAFVWQDGVMRDLNVLINSPVAVLTRGMAISEAGVILADTQAATCAILTPVLPLDGDTDCDHAVNINDLLNVINHWGPCVNCIGDLTGDGIVGLPDLVEVILNWGQGGGPP